MDATTFTKNRRNMKRRALCKWLGDFSVLADYLEEKSWLSLWMLMKIIHSYFKAIGAVIFAASPFTGILIFASVLAHNSVKAMAMLLAGVTCILTSKVIKVSNRDVCNGGSVFNSLLVGCILTELLPSLFQFQLGYAYWFILTLIIFITTFIDQGLQTMMAPSGLPVQSVPFNVVTSIVIMLYRAHMQGGFTIEAPPSIEPSLNATEFNNSDLYLILEGSIRGAGQVFGIGDTLPSIFIWIALCLFSPLLTFMCFVGSAIGTVVAVMVEVQPVSSIHSGLWSFNSLLAAAGITFFVVQSPFGIILSVVNALVAVGVQVAITPIFSQTGMPILSFPFNVAIMFILSLSLKKDSPFKFVAQPSFPEEHLLKHYEICGNGDCEVADEETGVSLTAVRL